MKEQKWTVFQWGQHKAIHWLYDLIVWLHDWLLEYACAKNLWRMPQERETEQPVDDQ
jgi:hypothetical protein